MTDDLLTDSYLYFLFSDYYQQSRFTRLKSYKVEQYDERSLPKFSTLCFARATCLAKTFPIEIMVEVHNLL